MTSPQADYNLAALAEAAFHRLGDHESLVFEGRTYRSGELFDRACQAASGLVKLGVSAGERVVVLMANCPEVGIAYSATWPAGAVAPPGPFLVSPPPLPLSHAYGMIVTLTGFHATERGLAVLQRWFDPAELLALAERHRIQRMALVPAMIQMLLAQPLEDADLSSLRYVNSGAAPLAAETREQWERRPPGCQILGGYGCTESGAVSSVRPRGASRPGPLG